MQVLLATCPGFEGHEALLCYALHGSAAFLAMYGFVPERNPLAALELFEDVHQAAAWAAAACPPPVRPFSNNRETLTGVCHITGRLSSAQEREGREHNKVQARRRRAVQRQC